MSFKSRSTPHLRSFDTETQFAVFQVIFEYYAGDGLTADSCTICWSCGQIRAIQRNSCNRKKKKLMTKIRCHLCRLHTDKTCWQKHSDPVVETAFLSNLLHIRFSSTSMLHAIHIQIFKLEHRERIGSYRFLWDRKLIPNICRSNALHNRIRMLPLKFRDFGIQSAQVSAILMPSPLLLPIHLAA